ncbi:MAG: LamG domain-containing protein [Bryobacteraceae bacterium]
MATSTLFERLTAEGDAGWAVRLSGEGRLMFRLAADDGTTAEVTSTAALSPGRWYHVAITKTDQDLRLYLDGAPDASGATPSGTFGRTHTVPIRIGGRGKATFNGWLDEIAFFDRALPEGEVRAMYRRRSEGPCVGRVQ